MMFLMLIICMPHHVRYQIGKWELFLKRSHRGPSLPDCVCIPKQFRPNHAVFQDLSDFKSGMQLNRGLPGSGGQSTQAFVQRRVCVCSLSRQYPQFLSCPYRVYTAFVQLSGALNQAQGNLLYQPSELVRVPALTLVLTDHKCNQEVGVCRHI